MAFSNNKTTQNVGMKITFPKSDEDHRLQLVEINGSIFAFVYAQLESNGPIRLECEDWSLVLLAPIKSKSDVVISGINVIRLNTVESERGNVNITASNQLLNLSSKVKSGLETCEVGKQGEYRFDDESNMLMNYFRLFSDIIVNAHVDAPHAISEAQKNFIACLCTLAAKAKGSKARLNIHKVLGFWDIPMLPAEMS